MGQAVEERRGHLGVAEDGRPFAEGQVGGDDDGCAFVSTGFIPHSARCPTTNGLTKQQGGGGQNWTPIPRPKGSKLHAETQTV
jgi:hypothetical protein